MNEETELALCAGDACSIGAVVLADSPSARDPEADDCPSLQDKVTAARVAMACFEPDS